MVGDVGRGGVAEARIDADLGKLVEQRVELARIKRIGKLPDEIGRPDKPGFRPSPRSSSFGTGKRSQIDGPRQMRSASISGCDPKRSRTAIFERSTCQGR